MISIFESHFSSWLSSEGYLCYVSSRFGHSMATSLFIYTAESYRDIAGNNISVNVPAETSFGRCNDSYNRHLKYIKTGQQHCTYGLVHFKKRTTIYNKKISFRIFE